MSAPTSEGLATRLAVAAGAMPLTAVARARCAFRWAAPALVIAVLAPLSAQAQSDNARRRAEYFVQQRAYPFQNIPAGALQRARRQAIASWPAQMSPRPGLRAGTWTPLGPEQISGTLPATGRMSAIAVDPTDTNVLYVGGAQGGVWKSTNGGGSWVPLTDTECSLAMGSIAIDPTNTNIIYAGTGEQHNSGDSYYGCGVLRSQDGGSTWTQLAAAELDSQPGGGAKIARVVLKPGEPTTVMVSSSRGIYRSTNSGTSWTKVFAGGPTDLVADPTDPEVWYAGVGSNSTVLGGVYKSSDGGSTWTLKGVGFPVGDIVRINLDIARSSPLTLYAAAVDRNDWTNLLGLYVTVDGAETWTKTAAEGMSCTQCWYDMFVSIDPTDPATVYFGGISLFKSTDAGATFTNIRGPVHVDQHYMTFDPLDANTLFLANDGGIYKSIDAGASWTTLNTNLSLTQFYAGVSLHPSDPSVALGGTQDNGTVQYEGSTFWPKKFGGDGGSTAIDFLDPMTRYLEIQWRVNGSASGPRRSDDGSSFQRKVNGIDLSDRALFLPPLIMDPMNPHALYFGTSRLYRTLDRGENWSAITDHLTSGSAISAIAVAPSRTQTIYVGTGEATLFVSEDDGATWSERSLGLPNRFIRDIAIHPDDDQTAYVTVSGFGTPHVFKTTDGGAAWLNSNGGLPDLPTNTVLLEPGTPSTVYVGTDLGVFRSTDGGGSFSPFNDGLPTLTVLDLAAEANTGTLVAATHGRGMWKASIEVPLSLGVYPVSRLDTLPAGASQSSDSALVNLVGAGSAGAGWSASTGGSSWLTLTTQAGTGRSRVHWSRNTTGLLIGTYVETITITAPALGSPVVIVDTLVVKPTRIMDVAPRSRFVSVVEGGTTPIPDSAAVTITGPEAETTPWEAVAGSGGWISMITATGTGDGVARWARDPTGLLPGVFVDTITISASQAGGSPAFVIDTLLVELGLTLALDPLVRADTTIAGFTVPLPDSAEVQLTGAGAETGAWVATHGTGSWLTLTSAEGTGSGTVVWSRDASALGVGTFVDTVTVTLAGAKGTPATIVDRLEVLAAIPLDAAVNQLLRGTGLDDFQSRFLDTHGNGDGTFNLGDVLAWFDRCNGATPGGCVASASAMPPAGSPTGTPIDPEPGPAGTDSRARGRRP